MTKNEMINLLLSKDLRTQIYKHDLEIVKMRADRSQSDNFNKFDERLAGLQAERTMLWSELMDRRTAARLMTTNEDDE